MTLISALDGTRGACGVPAWYALRTLSNRERAVQRAFDRAALNSFLPAYSVASKWSDRTKTVERILFPGYIFAHVDAAELPAALAVSGVISALPSNLRPVVISEIEIENVRRVITSQLPIEPTAAAVGDLVTITRGPLRGVSGVVTTTTKGLRLVVNVEMLGRAVAVKLDAADVAPGLPR